MADCAGACERSNTFQCRALAYAAVDKGDLEVSGNCQLSDLDPRVDDDRHLVMDNDFKVYVRRSCSQGEEDGGGVKTSTT